MLLKIGRLRAMIIHCMVQFIVDCCCGPDILKKKIFIIKRRLKSEIKKFPANNPYEIWWTTCYHSPLHGKFNLECCKSSVSDMGLNTIMKI